jgi:hypothetical protein
MNIITNRPIDTVNIDSGDDFYSMEGDYSNAKGDRKSKPAKATKDRTPKDKTQKNINKAIRKSNREKDKVSRRLNKSKAKVKPNAKPLTEKVSKDGKGKAFFEKIKGLFKRKNPKTGKDEYVRKNEKGVEDVIDSKDIEFKNTLPYAKEDIKQAIEDGAELVTDASGLIAEYSPEEVIAVDDEGDGSSEYYKKSDIEGNWWTKQSTTVKVAIVGGSLALVGFLGYMIFKSKK